MYLIVTGDSFVDRDLYNRKYGKYPLWPEILAKKLGRKLILRGISGMGNSFIYGSMIDELWKLKTDDVIAICSWTEFERVHVTEKHRSRRGRDEGGEKNYQGYAGLRVIMENLDNLGYFNRLECDTRNVRYMKAFEMVCEKAYHLQGPYPYPRNENGGHETFLTEELERPFIPSFYRCFRNNVFDKEISYTISTKDGHPNELGHSELAKLIYNSIMMMEEANAV